MSLFNSTIEADLIRYQAYKDFGLKYSQTSTLSSITFVRRIKRRLILNYDGIARELRLKTQFNIITAKMEGLTYKDQVELMASTDIYLSNHGAQLANIIFLRPNSIVIELFHPHLYKPCYSQIAKYARLKYYGVTSNWIRVNLTTCPSGTQQYPYQNCDIWVNRRKLVLFIKNITGVF